MSKPRSKTIEVHAALVYEVLPEPGQPPALVSKIAQLVPLTMPQVSTALQRLKLDGQAWNPNGRKTKSWAKGCAPAPAPEVAVDINDSFLAPETDPRQLELDLDIAPEPPEAPVTRAEFDRLVAQVGFIAAELGIEVAS